MTEQRTWLTEFGPAFDPGGAIKTLVESGVVTDTSAGNDVAPSFTRWAVPDHDENTARLVLWVERPDAQQREMGGPRFVVTLYTSDANPDILVAADSVEVVIAVLMSHRWPLDPAELVDAVQRVSDLCGTVEDVEHLASGERFTDEQKQVVADAFGCKVASAEQIHAVARGLTAVASKATGRC